MGKTMTEVLESNDFDLRHMFSGFFGPGRCGLCGSSKVGSYRTLYARRYPVVKDISVCSQCEMDHWKLMSERQSEKV